MSQFAAAKNPPWVRANAAGLVQSQSGASTLLTPQQVSHASAAGLAPGTQLASGNQLAASAAGLATGAGLAAGPTLAANAGLAGAPGLTAGGPNPLAAAVVAAAQNQQAQQGPAVSAAYGTGLATITLTQNALQQGAMLQQQGIAIPASLAATTQVANCNNGMVVEIARLPQPGVALPTSLATTQVATVSYPAPRLLAQTTQYQGPQPQVHPSAVVQQAAVQQAAAAAVLQQHTTPQQHQAQQQQQQQFKHRVFTGTVTKLHDNFGFIDEDVFFQISSVKGNLPKMGERVLVEANFSPNTPFKWNASRIQLLPNQVQLQPNNNQSNMGQQNQSAAVLAAAARVSMGINAAIANMANNQNAFSNAAQQNRWQVQQEMAVMESIGQQQRMNMQHNAQHAWIQEMDYNDMMDNKNMRMVNMGRRHNSPPIPRRERERERESRREERRDRYRERERYSPPARKRSRSPRRPSRSPPRRRPRVVPRYTVQIPKISLDLKTGNVMELRKRYSNLYIPSDFCAANFLWQEAFPPHRPFAMDHQCNFHIVSKDVEPLFENDSNLEPSDVDYSYSAKVMLMSTPSLNDIYHKSCALAQDGEDAKENFVHPTRLISFLVGLKGKNETVAIGGPWSPSLDGPNPDKDPSVLVKTAIRTCKSLTGIDLSQCSQWYRFAEIYYRRGESSSHKGRGMRVETVVLFIPDVWSCLPTRVEWDGMVATGCYKKPLLQREFHDETLDPEAQEKDDENMDIEKKEPTHFSELDPKTIKVNALKDELEARNLSSKGLKSQLITRLTKALKTESEKESDNKSEEHDIELNEEEAVEEEEDKEKENDDENTEIEKKEPTHFSELDPKTIKVNDLKDELEARNLSTKGLKSQLIARLTKALKTESEKETDAKSEEQDVELNEEEAAEVEEEKRKVKEEDKPSREEKSLIDKLNLPEHPCILVQPSKTAKNGKFDCTVMSLSLLLDYRQEDNKEHSFEVSLFAELFNEMMMRDFGFRIYRSLVEAPELKDEEKDKKKLDKKEDKKDRKDEDTRRKDDSNENDSDKDEDESDDDDIEEDRREKDRKKRRKRKIQMITHDPHLLLSFIYYDQTHCGYLLEKDVEEIFYTLGLMLSRAQVRKLIQKVCKREVLRYRKLTDHPAEGEKSTKSELSKINLVDLAAGNKKHIPSFKSTDSESSKDSSEDKSVSGNSSLVSYQGAFVDVRKLMDQLERSEKARLEADDKLKNLQLQLENLNETTNTKEKFAQKLANDLDEYKQKLRSTEEDLRKVKIEADRFHKTLCNLKDGLQSSLNITENALHRSKLSKSRNSPKRESESKTKEAINGQKESHCDNIKEECE